MIAARDDFVTSPSITTSVWNERTLRYLASWTAEAAQTSKRLYDHVDETSLKLLGGGGDDDDDDDEEFLTHRYLLAVSYLSGSDEVVITRQQEQHHVREVHPHAIDFANVLYYIYTTHIVSGGDNEHEDKSLWSIECVFRKAFDDIWTPEDDNYWSGHGKEKMRRAVQTAKELISLSSQFHSHHDDHSPPPLPLIFTFVVDDDDEDEEDDHALPPSLSSSTDYEELLEYMDKCYVERLPVLSKLQSLKLPYTIYPTPTVPSHQRRRYRYYSLRKY